MLNNFKFYRKWRGGTWYKVINLEWIALGNYWTRDNTGEFIKTLDAEEY